MTALEPLEVSVAGKVLDPSAVSGWDTGWVSMQTWVATAGRLGLTLLVPQLAIAEVLALRPAADEVLTDLLAHPQVLIDELSGDDRTELGSHLDDRGVFDVAAAWVGYRAQQRGWSVLSSDPNRLRRVYADVAIDPA